MKRRYLILAVIIAVLVPMGYYRDEIATQIRKLFEK